ncbi:SMP-30/gluconolactonase/LRE family protein [Endozoicomonas arenosclerae]|uniref:SMP-30/gluconolactonase/LRE family protein n=1 Tax=Endozoicomonas arenosclerae TaxID=1633495 RepID=UPI000781585C|nr:SMP-30/gluconolactonase/LRE family protein [Endozoicomonas arenosclerae]
MIFVEGLDHPESALRLNDGSWLISEVGHDKGRLIRVSESGKESKLFAQLNRPNGILQDPHDGSIWVAETREPSLLKLNPDGTVCETITGSAECPFLWPNDMALGPDGAIYLTDSGIHVDDLITEDGPDPEIWEGSMRGKLFRIDPVSKQVDCLDQGFCFANGIAFAPDGRLYISESATGHIYRYEFARSLVVSSREIFVSVTDTSGPCRVVGPDGIAFDENGNLYAAMFGQGHVATVYPNGEIHRTIVTRGSCPTDVVFGAPGSQKLYITEYQRGRIEMADVPSDGFRGYDD